MTAETNKTRPLLTNDFNHIIPPTSADNKKTSCNNRPCFLLWEKFSCLGIDPRHSPPIAE
ncbi:hypothetical protein RRG08_057653 [Elysia crispata]|uniref:Uncharacterized protein n=1 Tax=Elysia crispata TaxID=231223 RepID=A0AAE1A1Q7_9GAST|nr:hypothetical protein RRG08_057653 [Elysia crispata]